MTFYERLTELRREKGLTQKQIVDELNLGKNSFGDWKKGTIPVRSTQQLLAKYFGVSVDYLMGKTNNPIPNTETVGTYIPYEKRGLRPVIGLASAGTGVIAEEMIVGWEAVEDEYNNDNYFWLEVSGNSMAPKIDNGDRVLIQRDAKIESGCIAVAVVDGTEGFLKQVEFGEDSTSLHSFNPYYPDMEFVGADQKRLHFIGRVREMKRRF